MFIGGVCFVDDFDFFGFFISIGFKDKTNETQNNYNKQQAKNKNGDEIGFHISNNHFDCLLDHDEGIHWNKGTQIK